MGDKRQHLPRGTHQSPEGKRTRCVGKLKSALCIFLCWGCLITGLSVQVIRSEAAASCQNDDGIPKDIKEYCEEIGTEFNICPELLEAIAWHESRFIPTTKNHNHYGLMQINVEIHRQRIEKYIWTSNDMLKSYENIKVAADYLAELYELYGNDDVIILMMYTGGGWKAVEQYKEYSFLTEDVDHILTRRDFYNELHGK